MIEVENIVLGNLEEKTVEDYTSANSLPELLRKEGRIVEVFENSLKENEPLRYEEEGRAILKELGLASIVLEKGSAAGFSLMGSAATIKAWKQERLQIMKNSIEELYQSFKAWYGTDKILEELAKGKDGKYYMWFN